jgi:hypothetical protein
MADRRVVSRAQLLGVPDNDLYPAPEAPSYALATIG